MNRRVYGLKVRTWLSGLAVLAMLGLAVASWPLVAQNPANPAASAPQSAAASAGQSYAKTLSVAFREASDKVLPAVVLIRNTPNAEKPAAENQDEDDGDQGPADPFGDLFRRNPELRRFFRDMPNMPRMPRGGGGFSMGTGSGVIIDPSGIVLTNNHVIDGGGQIRVRLHDGRELTAKEVKGDPRTDLAILRLEGKGPFPAAKLGNSDQMAVGDWVLALGEPFGLEGTVTAGIISAKGRGLGITPRESFLQTDAAINPGNSGGPLVNLDGEVIGINTAISSRSGGYQGVGFAIPVNLARWVADQLVARGTVQRSFLGVVIQQVTPELADRFNVAPNKGVLISEVRADGPAAKAGLKPGDVVMELNGQAVNSPGDLQGLVEQIKPGTSLPMTVLREGKRQTIQVAFAEQPKNYGLAEDESPSRPGAPESSSLGKIGLEVSNLTPDVADRLGVKGGQGVVITGVEQGSVAQLAGLSSGMLISEVNRKPVKSVEDFRAVMTEKNLARGVLLLVRTERGTRFVVLRTGG